MNELKSSLALQRARRASLRKYSVSTLPRRSRKGLAGVGIVFGLALLGLLRLGNLVALSNPVLPQNSSPMPSATTHPAVVIVQSISPAPTPITRVVCASVGWVHVRFGPGDDQPVRGYLTAGETIVMDGDPGNRAWAHLSSPIVGWVDARFLCDAGEQP
jgi:hypothetical protein